MKMSLTKIIIKAEYILSIKIKKNYDKHSATEKEN